MGFHFCGTRKFSINFGDQVKSMKLFLYIYGVD